MRAVFIGPKTFVRPRSMPFSEASYTPEHIAVYKQLQWEAEHLPGAIHVPTPFGAIWMSSIEAQLYEAMRLAGLYPVPQFCAEGFFLDFAFPEQALGIEADGSVHDAGPTAERDHWRDMILRRSGWTILRFHGSTIYHGADRCAFVIRREVQNRIRWQEEQARIEAERRAARSEALLHPLRTLVRWLTGGKG